MFSSRAKLLAETRAKHLGSAWVCSALAVTVACVGFGPVEFLLHIALRVWTREVVGFLCAPARNLRETQTGMNNMMGGLVARGCGISVCQGSARNPRETQTGMNKVEGGFDALPYVSS